MRYFLLRLKRFCGYVAGFVFFISGILKLMDPVGASLVMKEYFHFLHIGFMDFSAMTAGILFSLAECAIGAGLITGVWRWAIAPAAIGFQSLFTLLTLLLVIFNPKMDCGCFGEAIHLTHSETFVKNLILLALLLIYYIPASHLGETKKKKYVSFGIVTVSVIAFAVYSLLYLPLNDYTDYHSGVSLKGETSGADAYQAVFTYEKDGVKEKFTIDNLPDNSWTFVSTETVMTGEASGDSATLSFHDGNGVYADSLALKGKVIVVSIYDTDLKEKDKQKIAAFMERAEDAGFKTLLLSSSEMDLPHYIADYKTLITLNRSNGGATYINDGFIAGKWAKKSLPTQDQLAKISQEDVTESIIGNSRSSLAFQGFLLYVFAVMLLL